MSLRPKILERLAHSPNLAVEEILGLALAAGPGPTDQQQLVHIILRRNKRAGWIALIKTYHQLCPDVRDAILERNRELYGPLSEAMQELEGPTRANVIEIVRRCEDPRLTYLLAQALIDARPEIRALAGQTFLTAILKARAAARSSATADCPFDIDAAAELRRAIDYALRQYKTHKQSVAVLAAMLVERQQDAPMWAYFHDPHEEISKTASGLLRSPPAEVAPKLAAATLLALASPLKPAAVAGFSATEDIAAAKAFAEESYRLIDPVLRDVAQSIGHIKLLAVLWKEAPPDAATWAGYLRLIDAAGLQVVEKVAWLTRLLEKASATENAPAPWKLAVMHALHETNVFDSGRLFARMLADADERVARFAARYLLSKKHADWRSLACAAPTPHLSVRRMVGVVHSGAARPGTSALNERVNAVLGPAAAPANPDPNFARVWSEYPELPPAIQHSTSRNAAASDPQFIEQMKAKLTSAVTLEIAQGLKMISVLPNLTPYRGQIITLCGHADVRVAGAAVRLVGRLEDPRLKDLLEAAAQHADPRVRANAVESMTALHIANRSQQVLTMLNSRHNRERANAIKAISEFDFITAKECLQRMLADPNPLHRISALWVVGQLALPELFRQVSSVSRRDPNVRVRKRAAEMIESLIGNAVPARRQA